MTAPDVPSCSFVREREPQRLSPQWRISGCALPMTTGSPPMVSEPVGEHHGGEQREDAHGHEYLQQVRHSCSPPLGCSASAGLVAVSADAPMRAPMRTPTALMVVTTACGCGQPHRGAQTP